MQEWLNWPLSKSGEPATVPRVRIPLSPPGRNYMKKEETTTPAEVQPPKTESGSLALMSMIFGVISLSGPGLFFGIPAIIMGGIALKRGQGERGLSITGIVTGILSTLISFLFIGLIIFGLVWGMNHPEYMEDQRPRPEYRLESSET